MFETKFEQLLYPPEIKAFASDIDNVRNSGKFCCDLFAPFYLLRFVVFLMDRMATSEDTGLEMVEIEGESEEDNEMCFGAISELMSAIVNTFASSSQKSNSLHLF